MLQIHCQEGDVIQSVEVAKAVVEFKAIEHPGPVRQAEDVVADQIAVAIDDAAVGHASLEQASRPARKPSTSRSISFASSESSTSPWNGLTWRRLARHRERRASRRPWAEISGVRRDAACRADNHPGKVHDHVVQWFARFDQCGQPPLVGHSAHHHHGLAVHAVDAAESCHAQVDIGGKPAIEFDLPTAGGLPLRSAPEVQESQVDRLLHLQGTITEENHHPGMGFTHAA